MLGSPSGIPEHWSLRVQVCMDEHTVTWGGYENTQRVPGCLNVWDYSVMAPLVFDRRQYEEQMRSLLPVTEGGYHSPWQSVFKTSVEWMKSRSVMHKTIFYAQQLAAEGPPASQADLVRAQAVQRELVRRLML